MSDAAADPRTFARTWLERGLGEGTLLIREAELPPACFDLSTGLLGELFQACVNHGVRVALVLAQPEAHGERIVELVRDHARHRAVRFFPDAEAAHAWLADPTTP